MKENHIRQYSLADYSELLDTALEMDYIGERDREKLKMFMQNPKDEGWRDL